MSSYKEMSGRNEAIFSKAKLRNYQNRKQIQVSWIIKGEKKMGLHCFINCYPNDLKMGQLLKSSLPHNLDKNEHKKLETFLNSRYAKKPFTLKSKYNPETGYNEVISIKPDFAVPCFTEFLKESSR